MQDLLKVEVEGLSRLKVEDIYRISGLYPSLYFESDDDFNVKINQGIQKLWEIERFANIQIYEIDNVSSSNKSKSIKIKLEELPVFGSISFYGNKKISTKQLIDIINIQQGEILSDRIIFGLKNKIIEKYYEKHFHNIDIKSELVDTNIEYIKNINISINEGKKIRVKELKIIGNNSFKKRWWQKSWFSNFSEHQGKLMYSFKNIKGEQKQYAIWRGKFSESGFDEDLKNLEQFYKNEGFKDFSILNKDIVFADDGIKILLEIDEGEKYYYKSFNFTGNNKFSNDELLDILDLKIGEVYNETKFNLSVHEKISSIYMDEGYYKFRIIPSFILKDDSLIVEFSINEDQKYKIRKVLISGNNKTSENVIRRELKIFPGDIFNRKNIMDSARELWMLGFFGDIVPQVSEVKNRNEIDITFNVVEKESGRANFSMGYNELNGITGGGGVEFPNFLGKGQMFEIAYQKGIQNQLQSNNLISSSSNASDFESFRISFKEPRINDTNNSIGFSISKTEQGKGSTSSNVSLYDSDKISASLSFGRRFKWPDEYFRGSWSLSIQQSKYFGTENQLTENFDESDIVISGNQFYVERKGVTLNQVISRDKRDKADFPTSGSTVTWSSSFSGGILGGEFNYNKHIFNVNWYTPVIKNLIFFQNYKFGLITELDNNQFIPYSARFKMGGSGIPYGEMLRGYPDNSIGPRSSSYSYYASSGGKIMLKYGVELRYLLANNPLIYMIFFAEAGNVWSEFENVDIFDLKRSAGLGIRLNMPMLGVLGYDMSYGFDSIFEGEKRNGWEYHLIFGMPFN